MQDIAPVHEIRIPGVHGPIHDWFVIPDWAHERVHAEGVEHEHRPATTEETR